jgi:hypothetical protein
MPDTKKMPPGIIDITAGVLDFVSARRKEDGGFGASAMLPATVEDTYYSLRILSALEIQNIPGYRQDLALKKYLSRMRETEWLGARTTFHCLAACCMAKVPVDRDKTILFVERRLIQMQNLPERYYCARIVREVLGMTDDPIIEQLAGHSTRPAWRDVSELWMNMYLMQGNKAEQEMASQNDLITWLQDCQNSDGGFGFLPGSTSFIENSYICLRALAFLDAAPQDIVGCRSFLISCRTGTGGFARANRAVAFLYSTWHAIAAFLLMATL